VMSFVLVTGVAPTATVVLMTVAVAAVVGVVMIVVVVVNGDYCDGEIII